MGFARMHTIAGSFHTWVTRSRAWISILMLTPVALVAVFSPPHLAEYGWGEWACNFGGWLCFVAGAFFRWWATLYIGARKDMEVVSYGAYSVCRNPLYFGTFLLTLAVGIFLQSLILTAGIIVVSLFYLTVTIRHEEKKLLAAFGEPFARYCERVPRFFPNFFRYQSPQVLEVRVAGLYSELIRAARWVWIPVICQLVVYGRTQTWWLHWIDLP